MTKDLIVFAQQNRENLIDLSKKIHTGFIPIRLTHNDTKLNNILFHSDSPIVKCVIDLDTVMPGTLLFDFGDMVRTISCTATEDEEDFSAIKINEKYFMGICNGLAKEVKDFINQNVQLELLNGAKYI